MEKKKIITICIIIVIIIFVGVILFAPTNNQKKSKNKSSSICEIITTSKRKKETFIIIINSNINSNGDIIDTVSEFKAKYNNLLFYEIDVENIDNECMENVLTDTGLYQDLIENKMPSLIGYLKGTYTGAIQNPTDLENLEKYFEETKFIKIKELKEKSINYEKYKENIELDEYFLIVIGNEATRSSIESNMNEIFSEKKYDLVNLKSDEGKKILSDIKQKTKIKNIYPQIFYFKDGKILTHDKVTKIRDLKNFKKKIDELT